MKKIEIELSDDEYECLEVLLLHHDTTKEKYIPFLIFKEYLLHNFRSLKNEKLNEKECFALNSGVLHTL